MEIPYTVTARPDTGLWNAKVGIWLFLASEVMLFGGLFSAYVFLRLDAEPGAWPHGLLNVPVGTMNTAILIASSVTVVLAWASLKMRKFRAYWWYMLFTILCGVIFLAVKLVYEWPQNSTTSAPLSKKTSSRNTSNTSATIISPNEEWRPGWKSPGTSIITRHSMTRM